MVLVLVLLMFADHLDWSSCRKRKQFLLETTSMTAGRGKVTKGALPDRTRIPAIRAFVVGESAATCALLSIGVAQIQNTILCTSESGHASTIRVHCEYFRVRLARDGEHDSGAVGGGHR